MSGRGECVRVNLSGRHHVEVDTQGCGLGEDVADLRFELGEKCHQRDGHDAQVLRESSRGGALSISAPH